MSLDGEKKTNFNETKAEISLIIYNILSGIQQILFNFRQTNAHIGIVLGKHFNEK